MIKYPTVPSSPLPKSQIGSDIIPTPSCLVNKPNTEGGHMAYSSEKPDGKWSDFQGCFFDSVPSLEPSTNVNHQDECRGRAKIAGQNEQRQREHRLPPPTGPGLQLSTDPHISCVACRRSKIKCTGKLTCQNCNRRGTRCYFSDSSTKILVSERLVYHIFELTLSTSVPKQPDNFVISRTMRDQT